MPPAGPSIRIRVDHPVVDAAQVVPARRPVLEVEGAAGGDLPDLVVGVGQRHFRLADLRRVVGEDEVGGAVPHHRRAAVLVHLQRGRLVHRHAPGRRRLAVLDLAGQEGQGPPHPVAGHEVAVGQRVLHVGPVEEVVGEGDRAVVGVGQRVARHRRAGAAVVVEIPLDGEPRAGAADPASLGVDVLHGALDPGPFEVFYVIALVAAREEDHLGVPDRGLDRRGVGVPGAGDHQGLDRIDPVHGVDVVVVAVGARRAEDHHVDLGRAGRARAAAHLVDDPLEGRVDVGPAPSEVMGRPGQGDDHVGGVAGQIAGDLGMGRKREDGGERQQGERLSHRFPPPEGWAFTQPCASEPPIRACVTLAGGLSDLNHRLRGVRHMRDSKLVLIFLGILAFVAVGFVLRMLEPVLVPFVVAVFLSRIFGPLNKALRRRRVPAALSILLILILVSIGLLIFGSAVYSSAQAFSSALPKYQARLKGLLTEATAGLDSIPLLHGQIQRLDWQDAVNGGAVASWVGATLTSFVLFFNDAFLVLLFLVFLLSGSEEFPQKLRRALNSEDAERVSEMMRNIETGIRRYIVPKTLFNLTVGAMVTALLAAFGVDFPLLWGLLAFLAHYIPSVGAVISVGMPTIFLFLQFSPGMALLIALLNAALQFVMGNAVEPRIMGSSLDLSPLLVLITLIFWGWLWGPWGMVLSVPITASLKIICENVAPLRPLAVLMSGSLEHAKPRPRPDPARAETVA